MGCSTYAVIMAGGHGTRFWPRSRKKKPKQFLDIVATESMIQQTVKRIEPLFPLENILIVTNKDQAPLTQEHLPMLDARNILAEPFGRNTAPALAFASSYLLTRDKDSIMVVLTADHYIQKKTLFLELLRQGIDSVQQNEYLITLGISPTFPETGYGYIQTGASLDDTGRCFKVKRFVEKPNKKTAERYISDGGYLWNSGMFIWKTRTFWDALKRFLPSMHASFNKLKNAWGKDNFPEILNSVYSETESISVDYGIMEKSDNVFVIPADIGWNDVGSWTALDQIMERDENNNIIRGSHICIDTENTIAFSPKKLIATIAIRDLIIVDTEDALLVCHKDQAQEIKSLVDLLKREGLERHL